jgi:hypothetical protein
MAYKVTYINPGESEEHDFDDYDTLKEALADAEMAWDDGTEVKVWKLVKRGTAKSVIEWGV